MIRPSAVAFPGPDGTIRFRPAVLFGRQSSSECVLVELQDAPRNSWAKAAAAAAMAMNGWPLPTIEQAYRMFEETYCK